jgi:uncharacterized protein (DUF1810 family)
VIFSILQNSGHTAVIVGKSKLVVFGGLVDKKFLSDITVYDLGTERCHKICFVWKELSSAELVLIWFVV